MLSFVASHGFETSVVAHCHKGMEQPFAVFAGPEKARLKRGLGTGFLQYPPAIISLVDDRVNRAGKFETKLAGHAVTTTAFELPGSATARALDPQFMGRARASAPWGKR
jgi:hypothetical protein